MDQNDLPKLNPKAQNDPVIYYPPIPSRATKKAIWNFAEEQRKRAKISNGFELSDLIIKNGGHISYIDFIDEDQTDAIVIEPNGDFLIRISSYTGALRDNFTIAHELGHKLLHWPLIRKMYPGNGMKATRRVDSRDQDLVRCEWEANWFASAFLMPSEEFKDAYKKGMASQIFGVTEAAAEVRAKSLGLHD